MIATKLTHIIICVAFRIFGNRKNVNASVRVVKDNCFHNVVVFNWFLGNLQGYQSLQAVSICFR